MAKIPFTVSARTARLIGQENFTNAEGAIIELVKNSYDADASNCIVLFQEDENGELSIFIIDNGVGMDDEIIKHAWMMIGTDTKLNNYESDGGRIKTGAKGIGRFALDRLGVTAQMFTKPENNKEGYHWGVDWTDFQTVGVALSSITADLNTLQGFDLRHKILEIAEGFPDLDDLIKTVDFSSGTIIHIQGLKDEWEESDITSLFDNLEVLVPPKEQPIFAVHLFSRDDPQEFGQVKSPYCDDFDYKLHIKYLNDEEKTVRVVITRNELDLQRIERDYEEVFKLKRMREAPFNFDTFKQKSYAYSTTISQILKGAKGRLRKDLIDRIGPFEFTFYFLKAELPNSKQRKTYPYKSFIDANRKTWLKKFGGIKIFRDEFRIRPYGENGNDWLNLGARVQRSPAGVGASLGTYRVSPNQVSGTINISRIKNPHFQDKSGREGLQENETFQLFKRIIVELIRLFERDRNTIMYSFSELNKKRNEAERQRIEAEKLRDRIIEEDEQEKSSPQGQLFSKVNQRELILARDNKAKEEEIKEKDVEIRLLRNLASSGLIVASFTHELKSIRAHLVPRTEQLLRILEQLIPAEQRKVFLEEDDPIIMVQDMHDDHLKIKHWLDYSLSALRKDKRTRTKIDFSDYFDGFKKTWQEALAKRNVKLSIAQESEDAGSIRAFEIDFDTVFNNLLVNSFDSFRLKREKFDREISIVWSAGKEFIEIQFSDNGTGLAEEYAVNPEEIFLPFETSKMNNRGEKIGTGMGLYLVKLIIDDYDGIIDILPNPNGFTISFLLPTKYKR